MKEKILALLAEIADEEVLASIYWYIERKTVRPTQTDAATSDRG